MRNKLRKFFIGLFEIFILLSIVTDPITAIGIIGFVVICTAGIALIPLILLSYLFGYLTYEVILKLTNKDEGKVKNNLAAQYSAQTRAIVDYIITSRAANIGDDVIKTQLSNAKWGKEFIEECFKLANR